MTDTNDYVSTGSYRIEPLKAHNWMPWKRRMLAVLRDQGLDKNLTEDEPVADITKPDEVKALQKWRDIDLKTQARIELAVSDAEMIHVMGASTAKEMWSQLTTVKESRGRMGVLATRRSLYRAMADEGIDMADHIAGLRKLQEELHIMGNKVPDDDFTMILITSLPESWDSFTTSFLGSSSTQSNTIKSQELVGILIDESRRRKEKDGLGSGGVAMQAKGKGYRRESGGGSELECFNCHKKGHMKTECWGKGGGREGQGPRGRKRRDHAHQAREVTEQSSGTNLNDVTFIASVLSAVDLGISKSDWILDSGTTSHICPIRDAFSGYVPLKGMTIEGVGGKPVPVEGRGDVSVEFTVNGKTIRHKLKETLHVPDAPNCLYSVSRLDEGGGGTLFKSGECYLKDGKGLVIGLGTKKNRLYVLKARTSAPATTAMLSSPSKPSWDQLHQRFGHISISSLQRLDREHLVTGFAVDPSSTTTSSCDACIQGKMTHRPFPQEAQNRSQTPGQRQMSDVCGPIPIYSIGGFRYFVSFTDDATRYSHVVFMKEKGEATQRVMDYCAKVERQFGKYPRWLRFDNGKEYVNAKMREWSDAKGITLETTAPHSSSQNGVAERFNRTHMELARSMMVARSLPSFLWDEAVAHANYLRNRVGTRALVDRTPYEAWFGVKPNVSHLREFGCDVWVLDETQNLSKLKPKARKMVFMGFIDGSKSIRYYDATTRRIKVSRNVSFAENENPSILDYVTVLSRLPSEGESEAMPSEQITADMTGSQQKSTHHDSPPPTMPESTKQAPAAPEGRTLRNQKPIDYKIAGNPQSRKPSDRFNPSDPIPPIFPSNDLRYTPDPVDQQSTTTTSSRAKGKERALVSLLHQLTNLPEAGLTTHTVDKTIPRSVEDARACEEAEEWEKAMKSELDNLKKMKTWELTDLPPGRTAIGSRMVFNKKQDAKRCVREFKARLVAQGFGQKPGVDFSHDGTFAPVMRFETLRTALALSAVNGWKLRQLDVKGAYLNGYLDEEIYMRQPPGFEDGTGRVCRLRRSLYGLKQAGNIWNRELDTALVDLGFKRLKSDNCCYMREQGDDFDMLLIWVDDILSISTLDARNDAVERDLASKFEIKTIGEPSMLLGIQVDQNHKSHSISLSQSVYIDTLLQRFALANANPVTTPMDPNVNLDNWEDEEDTSPIEGSSSNRLTDGYAALIGSLMYLAISTRPDIAFPVNKLAQFTSNPKTMHWTAVKRIFRYLKGTRDFALTYGGKDSEIWNEDLHIYCDADWASSHDRKSTSGFVITLAGGAVAWSSKKQTSVALSTAEAEYVAATHVAKQVLWHRALLEEFGILVPRTSTIFSDNQAAIAIAHNPEFHARTKHIDIAFHFLRDLVRSNTLNLVYINTTENLADIFTKGLPRAAHQEITYSLGVLCE